MHVYVYSLVIRSIRSRVAAERERESRVESVLCKTF